MYISLQGRLKIPSVPNVTSANLGGGSAGSRDLRAEC